MSSSFSAPTAAEASPRRTLRRARRDPRCPGRRTGVRRREFLTAAVAAVPLLAGARPVSSGAPRVAVRAGRPPLALATADTEGFVAGVDLAAGRRIGRVATLDGPRSIESRGRGPVVVAHTSAGAVTLL